MPKLARLLAIGVPLASFLAAAAPAWEVPLTVEKPLQGEIAPYVSGGVPLLPGQAKEPGDLCLAVKDGAGKLSAIPAQFRVLARWWRADSSIRWVLVDFASVNVPGERKVVYLTDAKLDVPAAKPGVAIEDKAEEIVISTGAATFTVSKKRFNFLKSAVVGGEESLDGSADLGLVLEDTSGEKYYGSEGTKSVSVLESGPVRACVRAQGRNLARGGKGYSPGMYGYDVFMNFYAGSSDVYADVIVANNPEKPIGSPTFKDASLLLKLKGGAGGYALWGEKPSEGQLAAGESVCLYQDSNGADTWETCTGFGNMSTSGWSPLAAKITSFRGYRVLKRAGGREEELAAGNQARGLLHASNSGGGLVMHTRNFWQQFPKAAEVAADGTVRLGLFPRECRVPHYLQDASAKGHELILHFYSTRAKGAYGAGADGRPQPAAVAAAWDSRAGLRPDLKHLAATGALCDLGPYTPPVGGLGEKPNNKISISDPRMLTGDALYGNACGWQVFGERWRSNGGHSTHGARQPIKEDCYLYRWYLSGFPEWLALGDARSRLFRDVRAYRIDDQDALAFANFAEFRKFNSCENGWASRAIPKTEELRKHQEGLWPRASWDFPNPEHFTLDLLYDRYLAFGDVRSLENMRVAAGFGAFFVLAAAPAPSAPVKDLCNALSRSHGWSWRTLERYWELTGDRRADELLKAVIKAYEPFIGKSPLWFANDQKAHGSEWFTQITSRAAAMTALHTGDAKALEFCKSLAEGKEERADYFCTLFAVLYHLTGEDRYKEAVMKKTNDGQALLDVLEVPNSPNAGKSFPASAHWLLNQPPKAKK